MYLFRSLAFCLPRLFFKEINTMFCKFIWNNRKSRLRLKLLFLPFIYNKGKVLTFKDLCLKYPITKAQFFKYLQVKHFISTKYTHMEIEHPVSCLEDIVHKHLYGKHQISILYAALMSYVKESISHKLRAWRLDIQDNIDESE